MDIKTSKQYVKNMTAFIESMSPSNIAFLFFFKAEMNQPNIICASKQFKYMNNIFYFVQAQDSRYCYVYKDSVLKYFVNNFQMVRNKNIAASIYTVDIVNSVGDNVDCVSIGNHLDFSVQTSRKDGPFFKIHYTEYEEVGEIGASTFIRNTNECNINANIQLILGSIHDFKKCKCYNNNDTIGKAYHDDKLYDISLIHKLCRVCCIGHVKNAGHTQSQGGAPITIPIVKYKGIHIGEPAFFAFIRKHLLDPLEKSTWEYDYSYMFMDMGQQLHEKGRHWIFVIVHFINANVKIIGINAHQVFKATYASMNPMTSSQAEKKCLKSMVGRLSDIVADEVASQQLG